MTASRISGMTVASVAAGFLMIAAPTFAGCGDDGDYSYETTEKESSKPVTAEKEKSVPTVGTAGTKEDKG